MKNNKTNDSNHNHNYNNRVLDDNDVKKIEELTKKLSMNDPLEFDEEYKTLYENYLKRYSTIQEDEVNDISENN